MGKEIVVTPDQHIVQETVVARLRSLVEEFVEEVDSCEDGEAAVQRAATDIVAGIKAAGYVIVPATNAAMRREGY